MWSIRHRNSTSLFSYNLSSRPSDYGLGQPLNNQINDILQKHGKCVSKWQYNSGISFYPEIFCWVAGTPATPKIIILDQPNCFFILPLPMGVCLPPSASNCFIIYKGFSISNKEIWSSAKTNVMLFTTICYILQFGVIANTFILTISELILISTSTTIATLWVFIGAWE